MRIFVWVRCVRWKWTVVSQTEAAMTVEKAQAPRQMLFHIGFLDVLPLRRRAIASKNQLVFRMHQPTTRLMLLMPMPLKPRPGASPSSTCETQQGRPCDDCRFA